MTRHAERGDVVQAFAAPRRSPSMLGIQFVGCALGILLAGVVITSAREVVSGAWSNPLGSKSGAGDFILAALFAGVIHLAVARLRRRSSRMVVGARSLLAGMLAYVLFLGVSRLGDLLPVSIRFSWVVTLLLIVLPVVLATVVADGVIGRRSPA